MDFFAQQARVRRSSRTLVLLFALAVLAIVVAVDLVCAFVLGVGLRAAPLLAIALAVVIVIALCSAYRIASLAGGGAAVARSMNASEVPADTANPQWKRLRNVIEEVAIASGVPVPEIYVMQDEPGINAFAAGYTPTDAAVCVTQGCLDKLNRDELQGVIAHEFSHVLNGDMRLNIRLIGLLFGIMAIGVIGRFLLYSGSGRSSRRDGGNVALAGLALFIVGSIGLFFGKLIQAAVARSRESLADASAVQFTRQTSGIAGALKKIAAFAEGSALQASGRDEVRHMLFGDAERGSLFATHPPILERIRALEPGFDPSELDAIVKQWLASGGRPESIELHAEPHDWEKAVHDFAVADGDVGEPLPGFPPSSQAAQAAPAASGAVPPRAAALAITAAGVAAQVASPGTDDYRAAAQLRARVPDALAAAVRNLLADVAALHPMLRLPLAQLAFPALKRRPRPELDRFTAALDKLIHADGRVDLDEYCLAKLVQVQVIAALDPSAHFKPGNLRLTEAQASLRDLCALMAHFGNDDADTARRAFQAAMEELARLSPEGKQLTVRALTRAIAADGVVNVAESELLRVVCAVLGCPLPPILGDHP